MKLTDFLEDEKYAILLFAAGSLVTCAFLTVFGVGSGELTLLWIFCALLFGGDLLFSFLRRKKRIRELSDLLDSLDRKYLIAEIADKPKTSLEKAYFHMLKTSLKSMTDEVAQAQRLNREYRELNSGCMRSKFPLPESGCCVRTIKQRSQGTFCLRRNRSDRMWNGRFFMPASAAQKRII